MRPPTRSTIPSAHAFSVRPAGASAVRDRVNSQIKHDMESARSTARCRFHPSTSVDHECRPAPAGCHSLSLGRSFSARFIGPPDGLLLVFGSVEGEQHGLVVDHGFQVNGPPPYILYVGEGVLRLVHFQIYPIMVVPQQEFAAVAMVPVGNVYPRFAEVRQAEEQALLDFLEFPGLDDVILRLILVIE